MSFLNPNYTIKTFFKQKKTATIGQPFFNFLSVKNLNNYQDNFYYKQI